jgi:hypothetical protein
MKQIIALLFHPMRENNGIVDESHFLYWNHHLISIEQTAIHKPNSKTFFEFNKMKNNSYYCSALGNIPFKAKRFYI